MFCRHPRNDRSAQRMAEQHDASAVGRKQRINRSSLRLHTELFSGYGDSLMDYNRQRTVLSVGLTLLDW